MTITHITKTATLIILAIFMTACNSTPKEVKLVKKALISDHYLLMSLLNRPVTQDQQMMLTFAQQKEISYNDIYVNAVSIKGPKFEDDSTSQYTYSNLIANDINSVALQGPETNSNKI